MRPLRALLTALPMLPVLVVGHLSLTILPAQAGTEALSVRYDTPSGFPVPRFVSLKSSRTHCRSGPSFTHPIAITYVRAGTPVLIVAETVDHWRKLRDIDGAECWAHRTTLRAVTHVVVIADADILTRPKHDAPARARFARGVLARLEKSEASWARISAGGERGWTLLENLWGVDNGALHN